MTLKEFEANYYLHDSFIESLNYDTANAKLTLVINFAFWMQKDFEEGEEENGLIEVTFRNVTSFVSDGGDPAGDFVSVLNTAVNEDGVAISLLDDENGACTEMKITAAEVDVKKL